MTEWKTDRDNHLSCRDFENGDLADAETRAPAQDGRRLRKLPRADHFKAHSFRLLQIGHDRKQVARLRVAAGTEHAHQSLSRLLKKCLERTAGTKSPLFARLRLSVVPAGLNPFSLSAPGEVRETGELP